MCLSNIPDKLKRRNEKKSNPNQVGLQVKVVVTLDSGMWSHPSVDDFKHTDSCNGSRSNSESGSSEPVLRVSTRTIFLGDIKARIEMEGALSL